MSMYNVNTFTNYYFVSHFYPINTFFSSQDTFLFYPFEFFLHSVYVFHSIISYIFTSGRVFTDYELLNYCIFPNKY